MIRTFLFKVSDFYFSKIDHWKGIIDINAKGGGVRHLAVDLRSINEVVTWIKLWDWGHGEEQFTSSVFIDEQYWQGHFFGHARLAALCNEAVSRNKAHYKMSTSFVMLQTQLVAYRLLFSPFRSNASF